ncbi:9021_t:CDS:2, partial [Dentiscutata erythropus]
DKNKKTTLYLFDNVSKEVPIVVVKATKTSAINTDSGFDSDDLSPLSNTEVSTITNLESDLLMIKKDQNSEYTAPKFPLCCANNKMQLLLLLKPLSYLLNLYTSTNPDAQVRDIIHNNVTTEISIIIHDNRNQDICHYNALTTPDVAAIMDAYLLEATFIQTEHQLRQLFATILLFCQLVKPELLWNNHKIALYKNILYQAYIQLQDLKDANDIPAIIEHEVLTQLKNIFLLSEKSLKNFSDMPIPFITSNINNDKEELNYLIREEIYYDITDLEAELQCNIPLLNNDQHAVFDIIIRAIDNKEGECFFIDKP